MRRIEVICNWYENYSILPTELECVLTFCDNATLEPNLTHNYALDWNATEESLVPLNVDLIYPCAENMKLQNETSNKKEASSFSLVRCGMDGLLHYPDVWMMCSDTVQCGQPPNVTVNGYRTWEKKGFYGTDVSNILLADNDDYYDVEIEYGCVNGSQFDTDNDGYGDAYRITNRCLWNMKWNPYPELPECKITHCVDPFEIPPHTMLEEEIHNTVMWTKVGHKKKYQCKGIKEDGTHTRFFEHNRSLSEFEIICLPDGTFNFNNATENWPICIEGHVL